jgi:hypothetical protein
MTIQQTIDTYLKGWELGDGAMSLTATAADFHYDDPNSCRIERRDFVEFVESFKQAAEELGGPANANPFLQYSDVVIDHGQQPVIVWCWWQAVGTDLQGSARILVDDEGVRHEKIAYFS